MRYVLQFEGGVLLEVETIRDDAFGPSIQEPLTSIIVPKVNIPGRVIAVHAPREVLLGVDWRHVANGFAVPLNLPEHIHDRKRPRRSPPAVPPTTQLAIPE